MSVEKLKGWFGWPDLVAETHGTRPRAILDLNDGVLLKIVGDGVDQKETGEARRAIADEDGNSRCHMRPGVVDHGPAFRQGSDSEPVGRWFEPPIQLRRLRREVSVAVRHPDR